MLPGPGLLYIILYNYWYQFSVHLPPKGLCLHWRVGPRASMCGVFFLNILVKLLCLVTKSYLFCLPQDCSLPGSSVHEIFQTRLLERVVISSYSGKGDLI